MYRLLDGPDASLHALGKEKMFSLRQLWENRVALFIASFISLSIAIQFGARWSGLVATIGLFAISKQKTKKGFIGLVLGCGWASTYSGEIPLTSTKNLWIDKSQGRLAIATDSTGRRLQTRVRGQVSDGERGSIYCRPTPKHCLPTFHSNAPRFNKSGAWQGLTRNLRLTGQAFLAHQSTFYSGWLNALFIGDRKSLSMTTLHAFKQTGVYHLLVTSGLHVGLACQAAILILQLPFLILYALKGIPSRTWLSCQSCLAMICVVFALIFCHTVGASQASQRAAILFAGTQVTRLFCGRPNRLGSLKAIAVCQILLFPIGFTSRATLLSWGAYLFITLRSHLDYRGTKKALVQQGKIYCLVCTLLGLLHPLTILINLLLVPLFPAVFLAAGLLLIPNVTWPWLVQDGFIQTVFAFSQLTDFLISEYPNLKLPANAQSWLAVPALFFFLNSLRNPSITKGSAKEKG